MKMKNFIKRYIYFFGNMNLNKIISFYSFPLIIIDENILNKNPYLIIKNKKELKKYFNQLFKILKNIYKYKKTKILKITSIKEGKKFGLIKLIAIRINIENKSIKKIKISYFLKKTRNKYRISCFIVE